MATWRDLRKRVKKAGGTLVRQGKSSAERWRLPSGKIVTLDSKHPKEQVRPTVAKVIEDALQEESS